MNRFGHRKCVEVDATGRAHFMGEWNYFCEAHGILEDHVAFVGWVVR